MTNNLKEVIYSNHFGSFVYNMVYGWSTPDQLQKVKLGFGSKASSERFLEYGGF